MTALEIITRKRDGQKLTEQELDFLISGYVRGDIPDYQLSAFLMAVFYQGMDFEETAVFTRLMRDSGIVLNHDALSGPKVDKHSTGGVGDKVSLVLGPLVAACGVINPMISGRSLAHTGGTLDKLEAIPGFNTQLDIPTFKEHLARLGVCLIGQTPEICPADKKLYALRDATATVDSLPLICGSILSKKLAEGLDALVLDVKCGSGAIFADPEWSEKLAHALVHTAAEFGLKTVAVLTQMEQPLGRTIGNWLETREAIDMLHGKPVPEDFYEVTVVLSAMMVWLGKLTPDFDRARALVEEKLASGAALQRFRDVVAAQGGDVAVIDAPENYPEPGYRQRITADQDGWLQQAHARTLGQVSMLLGAGRLKKESDVDPLAGIIVHKKVGDPVRKGELLAELCADRVAIPPELRQRAESAFTVSAQQVPPLPTILATVDTEGRHEWRNA